jgi:hypothetical protein
VKKAFLLLLLAACNPYLYQASAPPPARTARLDPVTNWLGVTKRYRLEVSEGVAVAMRCEQAGPCEHMTVLSENPAVAEVRMASLSQLQTSVYGGSSYQQQPLAGLVVVGKTPGITKLHVKTKDGSRLVTVTVIAPPTVGNPVTAAAPTTAAR